MQFRQNSSNLLKLFAIFLSLTFACVEKDVDPSDPAASFAYARKPYDDEMYEIAIQRLGEFKSRFPYSKNAPDAEIMIANSHYQMNQYAEAAAAYEQFVKLHPRHEQADYAQFRVGESYWADAPEEIDREQEYTIKAIAEWQKLNDNYPNSKEKAKAEEFLKLGRRRVADHSVFIAKFYCKKEIYHACAYRYIDVAEQYPQFKDIQKLAFQEASVALGKLAKTKAKDEQSDTNIYFKSMSAAQLEQKSEELGRIAAAINP